MKKFFSFTIVAMLLSLASFALDPIKGVTNICETGMGFVDDSLFPGGTWSSSNTAVATVTSYTSYSAMVNGVSAGTATITYTLSSTFVTHTVTVDAMPTITGSLSFCVSTTSTLTSSISGGGWASSTLPVATVGASTGIVTGVGSGTSTIYYKLGACIATSTVTVITSPRAGIAGAKTVCVGATVALIDSFGSTGTWTSSSTGVATISSGGIVTGVSAGTSVISFTVTSACGTTVVTMVMTVTATTSAGTISGATSVMATATTGLTSSVSGGVWTSSNSAVATVNPSTGVVTGVATGTATITYTLTGACGTAFTTAPMTVVPFHGIEGDVLFGGSSYFGQVKVWLIKYNPTTLILQAIDSTTVYCTTGTGVHYKFAGAPTDSFRVKASADTSTSGFGYIPTYHNSSFYWYSATVFYHVSGTTDINKDINMMTGMLTSGPGFIGGNVTTGANKGTGSTPSIGLRMYVLDASGNVRQKTTTDASGNYSFSNLPVGTYSVFPEALSYKTTPISSITLTAGAPSFTTASFLQRTVSYLIVPLSSVLDVNTTASVSSVAVFPNPTNGTINIQWNTVASETGNISITDVAGRQVYTSSIDMTQGQGVKQIDFSALNSGNYIINVTSASINYSSKMEVSK